MNILYKCLVCISTVAWGVVGFQIAYAQKQLPVLRVTEYREIDQIKGASGIVNLEIVLSISNGSQENVTVYGQNFSGEFSPIGAQYSVSPKMRKFIMADEETPILKADGRSFTANRILKPGESLNYSLFVNGGNSTCIDGLVAIVWVRIGNVKKIKRINSAPLKPCS